MESTKKKKKRVPRAAASGRGIPSRTASGTPEIEWKRGKARKSTKGAGRTHSSVATAAMPDVSMNSSNTTMNTSRTSSSDPDLHQYATTWHTTSRASTLHQSYLNRNPNTNHHHHESDSDNTDDFLCNDDIPTDLTNSASACPNAPNTFWEKRQHQRNVVDQEINLMDSQSGQYEKRRGGLGSRQRSLVEIFLSEESTRDLFYSNHHKKQQHASSSPREAYKREQESSAKLQEWCCFLSLCACLLVAALILTLPAALDRASRGSSSSSTVVLPTNGPNESDTPPLDLLNQEAAPAQQLQPENNSSELDKEDPPMPPLDVASIPNTSRLDALQFLVVDQDISKVESFDDPTSPASMALAWIAHDDPANLAIPGVDQDASQRQLMQRYALAVFYFSQQQESSGEGGRRRRMAATGPELVHRQQFDWEWATEASVCDWPGIVCNSEDQLVTEIHLSSCLLGGSLPREILEGSALPALIQLDLSHNQIEGTLPHLYESNLVKGRAMAVSESRLESLLLQNNRIQGTLDPILSLGHLTSLDISNNQLTGTIPFDFGTRMKKLSTIQLADNNLHGTLPLEWPSFNRLAHLNLQGNPFAGKIPDAWLQLSALEILNLSHSDVTGTITSALASMTALEYLSLQHTGIEGTLPSFLGKLEQLKELRLDNSGLSGSMPSEICSLMSPSGLQVLTSDCSELGSVTCDCCTTCLQM